MKKSLSVLLFAAGIAVAAVPAAWVAFLVLGKESPSPVVLAVTGLIGAGGGAFIGARFWDDRQVLRERADQEKE
ncbi:hypothetical protein [Paenarthrobacter sp. 2TAF44]|uniref:hypothetical protein n=1 Tax=Paenarthrobacter sp. 2TAF44 TaxID=3233018 RepID=UPI003F95B004